LSCGAELAWEERIWQKNKNKRAIGLMLNSAEIRAAEISGGVHQPKVTAFGRMPLPPGLILDGMLTDIPKASSLLGQLLKNGGFSGAPIFVGVKNQNVLLRMASFPKVPPDKMRNAVLFQAQQFIPVPVSELVLDYVTCGDVPDSDPPMVNALLVGGKKDFLDGIIDWVQAGGRTLRDIDSGVLASVRAVIASESDSRQTLLFADVDRETISMSILPGQYDTDGSHRTAHSPASSAFIRSRYGAAIDGQAEEALASQLASDIGASIRYFVTQRDTSLDGVRLTGSLDKIEQIARRTGDLLGEQIRVPALIPGYPE
jgi:type IV pilus assembly protein PilM